jgi:ABC-type dipeptide/oligopeptide/nickel transport system permease component
VMDSVAVPTVLMNHLTASRCVLLASFSAKLTECAMNHITAVMDGVYVETARMNGIAYVRRRSLCARKKMSAG